MILKSTIKFPFDQQWQRILEQPWAPARCQMQGAEERRLRRISNTPQGEATEGNAADDALMVDQGVEPVWVTSLHTGYPSR
jgi:hypothetical protein